LTCSGSYVDVDGVYSNGCECLDSGFGQSCNTATAVATVAVGGSATRNGNLPRNNEENWFAVPFAYTDQPSYHPKIVLTAAAGTTMLMDIKQSCGGGAFACTDSSGAGVVQWETTGGGNPPGSSDKDGKNNYSPTPNVGTLWVRVYQVGGARTCAPYTLTFSN
jgi:hypothetical protein